MGQSLRWDPSTPVCGYPALRVFGATLKSFVNFDDLLASPQKISKRPGFVKGVSGPCQLARSWADLALLRGTRSGNDRLGARVQGLSFGVRRLVAAFARRELSRQTSAPVTSHRRQKAGASSRTPKTPPPISAPATRTRTPAPGRPLTTRARARTLAGVEVHLTPERKAQLDDYARRHGQDPAAALDDALAAYLEWERQDYQEAVEGIRQGYDDLKAGHTQPADEVLEELRVKHGLSR